MNYKNYKNYIFNRMGYNLSKYLHHHIYHLEYEGIFRSIYVAYLSQMDLEKN